MLYYVFRIFVIIFNPRINNMSNTGIVLVIWKKKLSKKLNIYAGHGVIFNMFY